jgi:hypothetical protein
MVDHNDRYRQAGDPMTEQRFGSLGPAIPNHPWRFGSDDLASQDSVVLSGVEPARGHPPMKKSSQRR